MRQQKETNYFVGGHITLRFFRDTQNAASLKYPA